VTGVTPAALNGASDDALLVLEAMPRPG